MVALRSHAFGFTIVGIEPIFITLNLMTSLINSRHKTTRLDGRRLGYHLDVTMRQMVPRITSMHRDDFNLRTRTHCLGMHLNIHPNGPEGQWLQNLHPHMRKKHQMAKLHSHPKLKDWNSYSMTHHGTLPLTKTRNPRAPAMGSAVLCRSRRS